jgi:DNA-binding SARP family transcriptional activator
VLAGDPAGGAARLRDALELWCGAPLADLALVDYLQVGIRRWLELRLVAVIERIDADLALGAGSELIAELETLITAEPLQERLRGQLMLALYRAGDRPTRLRSTVRRASCCATSSGWNRAGPCRSWSA